MRQGVAVAIVGAPNAGKSSLLNQIAGREAAIVSHVAGTTRDVIEVELDLRGWPVILSDTAGLRESDDPVEQEGIKRARSVADRADLKLVVFDGSQIDAPSLALLDQRCLAVINKTDQGGGFPDAIAGHDCLRVSAKTGEGIDGLLSALESRAESAMSGHVPSFGRARHRAALSRTVEALKRFDPDLGVELAAEELRAAAAAIGSITGIVLADDVLDVVFREFCIGK